MKFIFQPTLKSIYYFEIIALTEYFEWDFSSQYFKAKNS